jgi:endonuclease/exonuclease/phosphatase family metal-dependent hydrolase
MVGYKNKGKISTGLKAFCVSSLMLLYACPRGNHAQSRAIRLKVLSYNIHYGVGMDSRKDLKRIAGVISRLDPDIVGLQEVSDSLMTDGLARMTGMRGIFGGSVEKETPNLYHLLGIPVPASQLSYGDAILSKYPFEYIGNLSIPSASSSRYEAMCVDVDLTGEYGHGALVRFITTHFDYLETLGSRAARAASVEVIEQAFIPDSLDKPALLTGDLNATPQSATLKLLRERGWVSEDLGKDLFTVPSSSPHKQIDYVLIRPGSRWMVKDVSVINEGLASDHRPILMTLELIDEEK